MGNDENNQTCEFEEINRTCQPCDVRFVWFCRLFGRSYHIIKNKLFTDGYRCALSYSELFNRNDQQEFLLIKYKEGEEGGLFRLFAAGDFFSDRAIKSVTEIHLDH
ncbi:MAG: hypothetical protein JXN62_04120 [Bacteroidales bacterium]|nr:hypothetical protein [Bacteroidales bacterium]